MEDTILNNDNSVVNANSKKKRSKSKVVKSINKAVIANNSIQKRYELAFVKKLNELPHWKRAVINDCIANKTDDYLYDEFVKEVILLAENESQQILLTT